MTRQHPPRSDVGERQDAQWADFVVQLHQGPERSFDQQWSFFRDNFANRSTSDGPPRVWRPPAEIVRRSNIGTLMRECGFATFAELHQWSAKKREEFWRKAIERLGIVFSRKPALILNLSRGVREPLWLPGAEMNCVDSCFQADPEKPAVIMGREGSDPLEATTYGELEILANRVANGLKDHGFAIGEAIALYMPMNLECIAAYLGILRAGCRVVSIADSFSPGEVGKRLGVSRAKGIVTVESYLRAGKRIALYDKVKEADAPRAVVIPESGRESCKLRSGDILWTDLLSSSEQFASERGDPYRVTNILFSSGTTGTPKAIPWTHLTPIKCAMDGHFHQDIHPEDVVAWPTNIGWMMGPWLIYATLMNRATLALFEGAPLGPEFIGFVRDAGISILGVVPSLVRAWRTQQLIQGSEWSGVRLFSSTGEPSNQEDTLWLMSTTGYRAPVIEYLGGTEIGGGHLTGTLVQSASPGAFTTPALGIDFVILNESGKPVEEGDSGELYLIPPSIGLSQQILNADHQKVYYQDCPPGPNGEVLRRHGDQIRRLPFGFYKAQGRADDAMNLAGIKVSSRELEQVMDSHDSVYESAAIGVQMEGEGVERLIVYSILNRQAEPDRLRKELDTLLAERLNPLLKIHDLVITDELPRTASNKVMRRKLRAQYLEMTPVQPT